MKKSVAASLVVIGFSVGFPLSSASSAPSPKPVRTAPTLPDPDKPIHVARQGEVRKNIGRTEGSLRPEGIAGGFVFVPINPFRAFDSRAYVDGYLLPGDVTWFDVISNEAGAPMIPSTAVAVAYNLTVTDTTGGGGFLAIYPANITWPGNSSINWTENGTTLANGGTVTIGFYDAPGQVEVYHGPGSRPGGTDFIVDITGYYI